jgi:ketosteroid isomerase-like protein
MTSNSEVVRSIYAAFGRGDIPAVIGALAPGVSWTDAEGFPYGGTYSGPDAVLQNVFMKIGTEWETYSAVPEEFIADGNTIVALGLYSGVYKATGKKFTTPFAHVWTLQGGKVVRFRQHTDTAVVQKVLR